ncbi:MAG: ribonuclease D [Lachnospiraceae bacterium]|nr:ribonuclease D [Lachnospiraceae bacterium]
MASVRRINLKTDCEKRDELIDFCLMNPSKQYVAIGWSCVYTDERVPFADYKSFYYAVKDYIKSYGGRMNHALNSFWYVEENDLFWTRDLEGMYWVCRALGASESMCDKKMDIGAIVPVKAVKVGLEVPGQIKAQFNRANGGIICELDDSLIENYSKYIYNKLTSENAYSDISKVEGNIINNLPDFELEELVISYLQIVKDYYVLSNSIARKSTTVCIECELIKRDKNIHEKAVVQVKAKEGLIDYRDYEGYLSDGFRVYVYDGGKEIAHDKRFDIISRKELEIFYHEYKSILPESITMWENVFA